MTKLILPNMSEICSSSISPGITNLFTDPLSYMFAFVALMTKSAVPITKNRQVKRIFLDEFRNKFKY